MTKSAYRFSVERDVQEEMACFEELKSLKRILVLYIGLERIPCFSNEDISSIDRLRQFYFSVGPTGEFFPNKYEKRMVSIWSLDLRSEERIGPLLSNASSLDLCHCSGLSDMLEDLVINSTVVCFAGLKSLTIRNCSSSVWRGGCAAHYDLLPNLEELYLGHLDHGKSISELLGQLGLRFIKLKLIQVEYCSEMKHLLPFGYFIQSLPKLEQIKVRYCDRLGELFSYDSIQHIVPNLVVPSLRILELEFLPELRTLCRDEEIWPLVENVCVFGCDLVRSCLLLTKMQKT
jgi:disease resistance protein RPS2